MKIRHPGAIKVAGLIGSVGLRAWLGTINWRYQPLGPDLSPHRTAKGVRLIYATWHENMLLTAFCFSNPNTHLLVSQHADGSLFAEVFKHLGLHLVRGSTARGGVEALRQMVKLGQDRHLAIAPDGPRGPRRQIQAGLVYLAAKAGLPIVPVGLGMDRPWRLQSWDRFALPRPGSQAYFVTDQPIAVPAKLDREQLERYRQVVENSMQHVCGLAEDLAERRSAASASPGRRAAA